MRAKAHGDVGVQDEAQRAGQHQASTQRAAPRQPEGNRQQGQTEYQRHEIIGLHLGGRTDRIPVIQATGVDGYFFAAKGGQRVGVARGDRTQKEISVRLGLAQGHVSKYLSTLRDAGFVERRVPVTAGESSRHGRYHVTDPYLRFYYRFLADRQAQLAMGEADMVLAEIKKHLLDFIATHTWEELCREWTLRAGARGLLDLAVDQVGSGWTKQAQVDVVALNSMEKTLMGFD